MNSRTSGIHSEMSTRHSHNTDLSGPADPSQLVKKGYLESSWEHGLLCNSAFKKESDTSKAILYSVIRKIKKYKQCPPPKWDHPNSLLPLAPLPSSPWHPVHGTVFTRPVPNISRHRTPCLQHSYHVSPAVSDSNTLSTLNFLCYFRRLNISPISGLTHWARCRTALQSEEEGALLLLSSGAGSSSSLEMLIILATFCGGVSEKTANGWWGNQQRRGNSPQFVHLCLFMLNFKNLLSRMGPENWLQNSLFGKCY